MWGVCGFIKLNIIQIAPLKNIMQGWLLVALLKHLEWIKETFALVAKMNSVRVLLSIAINFGWFLYQMNVKNAFLHGELKEEVYMKLPLWALSSM